MHEPPIIRTNTPGIELSSIRRGLVVAGIGGILTWLTLLGAFATYPLQMMRLFKMILVQLSGSPRASHYAMRVYLELAKESGIVTMARGLSRTVPAPVAIKESWDVHTRSRTGLDGCFDPIRLHIECMRINCIYRTLEAEKDAHVCEGLEEKQKQYGVNASYIVTRQDCLDRITEVTTGKAFLSHGTALRVYCSASRSHITIGHVPPLTLTARPGDTLHFTYQWIGPGIAPSHFQVFIRIKDKSTGNSVFEDVYDPPIPTEQWKQTVGYSHEIQVPSDMKSGAYDVVSGLCESGTHFQVAFKTLRGNYVENVQLAWLQVQ